MSSGDATSNYLIVRPENGGFTDLFKFAALGNHESGRKFIERGSRISGDVPDPAWRWVLLVSIIARKIIKLFGKPMEWFGFFFDFLLNLLFLNGNILGLFKNLLQGKVVIPQRGSETYISTIGHIDGRIDLYKSQKLTDGIRGELGNRALMDLCIMAAKLAYENANVVRNVVNLHWKMHFVDFYNCWNDYQKEMSTQVFILTDRPKDANLILVSFRGTEPFDADDWITDFDYSWYEIPGLGRVHMGFSEALGLGTRKEVATFQNHFQVKNKKITSNSNGNAGNEPSADPEYSETAQKKDVDVLTDMINKSAYYVVRSRLKTLLEDHKNAKFIVTGHSLGGALAILFPVVLCVQEENEVMQRLLGVYTFGQPRVGDRRLGKFMERKINYPIQRYFRVVYCNDLVPRLPYDDKTFLYKHFGACLYYNSCYTEQRVDEEPNPNFYGWRFLIPKYLNAAWELVRSFLMSCIYGQNYKESWCSTTVRMVGLVLPGLSAHCPTDYVNSVRLGRAQVVQMSSM
uniref:Fungal lipase-type domain-containing protein n=1 Tax=Kalanchoe fedtschenkoi TaxID=63787 RepID=A0A7N0T2X1_KALFE